MNNKIIYTAAVLLLAVGCATGKGGLATVPSTQQDATPIAKSTPLITQVDYKEPITPDVVQPSSVAKNLDGAAESVSP